MYGTIYYKEWYRARNYINFIPFFLVWINISLIVSLILLEGACASLFVVVGCCVFSFRWRPYYIPPNDHSDLSLSLFNLIVPILYLIESDNDIPNGFVLRMTSSRRVMTAFMIITKAKKSPCSFYKPFKPMIIISPPPSILLINFWS